ncbi:MAG: YebC/PmpR family DNA-binding transcriptional regulator [Clostridia bacterium]|nr:YebC/PmpR family DNA-binding transcriptional regulator [Clostridia bacterium]
MSGHNKWSTIKNKKAKTDAAKGKIFTKIGREIVIAVKTGGSADPALNSKLKDVIAKAKAANMPNDNIMRSIKKAAGEGESANYKEVTYEGYAPCGVAVIVEVVTDNLNRTASEVRHIFDKCGGSLGASGCVSWKFERKGVIVIDNAGKLDEDEMMNLAIEAGAEDVEIDEDTAVVYTDPADFSTVRDNLENAGCVFLSAERTMLPTSTTALPDEESVEKVRRLIDWLDDYDDTENVYHDAELPEEEDEE